MVSDNQKVGIAFHLIITKKKLRKLKKLSNGIAPHVCKDTNLFIQDDLCDYFNHKFKFLPNKQLTEIIFLSLGRLSKANFNSHVFKSSLKLQMWFLRE